jgi:hypothetical protein
VKSTLEIDAPVPRAARVDLTAIVLVNVALVADRGIGRPPLTQQQVASRRRCGL